MSKESGIEDACEAFLKVIEVTITAIIDFMYQYRRSQLLAWLLDHGIPIGPAKWLSEKCPKRLLPKE